MGAICGERLNPPSLIQYYPQARAAWDAHHEPKCLEREFGRATLVQKPESGELDEPVTSSWFRSLAMSHLLPAKATPHGIGIADGDREPKFRVRLGVAGPVTHYTHVGAPNVSKYQRDYADAPWALSAAALAVRYGNLNQRRQLFAELSAIAPKWCSFPEFFVWLSAHTTGAKSAGGGRRTVLGMADLLREGPETIAAHVEDGSIRRRLLAGGNDLPIPASTVVEARPVKRVPKLQQPERALDFFRRLGGKPKADQPVAIPSIELGQRLHSALLAA